MCLRQGVVVAGGGGSAVWIALACLVFLLLSYILDLESVLSQVFSKGCAEQQEELLLFTVQAGGRRGLGNVCGVGWGSGNELAHSCQKELLCPITTPNLTFLHCLTIQYVASSHDQS